MAALKGNLEKNPLFTNAPKSLKKILWIYTNGNIWKFMIRDIQISAVAQFVAKKFNEEKQLGIEVVEGNPLVLC